MNGAFTGEGRTNLPYNAHTVQCVFILSSVHVVCICIVECRGSVYQSESADVTLEGGLDGKKAPT